jgi:hypothetical protein
MNVAFPPGFMALLMVVWPMTTGVQLLLPSPNELMRTWPVLKRVNASGRGDDDPIG